MGGGGGRRRRDGREGKKKSSRFGPCQSEIIVCLILSLMDDSEFSNGPAPMTNTILIFINRFDNANFDAVVKGPRKVGGQKHQSAAQGGEIICAAFASERASERASARAAAAAAALSLFKVFKRRRRKRRGGGKGKVAQTK